MSKSTIIIVVAVIAVVAAGGAYRFLRQDPVPAASTVVERAEAPTPAPATLRPDHGNFQKRFQPTMPPAGGSGK
jgi:multidrug efflux pump subunit AcrA (membrane-fusion protein)